MEKKVKDIPPKRNDTHSFVNGTYDEYYLVSGDKFDLAFSDFELHVKTDFECRIIILRPTDLPF